MILIEPREKKNYVIISTDIEQLFDTIQCGVITHLEPDILECEVKWALKKHHYEQS